MSETKKLRIPAEHEALASLAHLFERVESGAMKIGADQYRTLVARLHAELAAVRPGEVLQGLLGAFPATSELYENLNYQHAGLCRSPLEPALNAELEAVKLLGKLKLPKG